VTRAAFPLAIASTGQTACADPADEVAQMLEQILFVTPGERVNRPDFGCSLRSLTFSTRTSELDTAIEALVEGALRRWAGDAIHIRGFAVEVQEAALVVTIRYFDRRTQAVRQIRVSN
jgi:uncharacterized protein